MIVKKKVKYWLIFGYVIFWIEYPVLYMYRRSFVIKTYLYLFNMVLDSSPIIHTTCRIGIELVVLKGMHWERAGIVGSAGREEEGGYCPFLDFSRDEVFPASVATVSFLLRQVWPGQGTLGSQQRLLGHDRASLLYVVT